MTDRALTAAAAGLWLAHTQLIPRLRHNSTAAKAYDQGESVVTSINNLKGVKR